MSVSMSRTARLFGTVMSVTLRMVAAPLRRAVVKAGFRGFERLGRRSGNGCLGRLWRPILDRQPRLRQRSFGRGENDGFLLRRAHIPLTHAIAVRTLGEIHVHVGF